MVNKTQNKSSIRDGINFVAVLHGLHQSPIFMRPISKQLAKLGFTPYAYRYHSLKEDIHAHANRLHEQLLINHNPNTPLHLVAHSLGGLVVRQFLTSYPMWQIGRVVTLGTPHLGSICADYAHRFTPPLINKSYLNALDGQCANLPDGIELGVIAGNRPFGIGQPALFIHNKINQLSGEQGQNDGTVYVRETRLPNAKDHLILPVTHTGLVHNKECHRQMVYFLDHGHFDRA